MNPQIDRLNGAGRAQAQSLVDEAATHGVNARIDLTWRDHGADWIWETILYDDRQLRMSVQALSPKEWDALNTGMLPTDMREGILAKMIR